MRAFTVLGPSQSGKSTLVETLSRLEAPRPDGQVTVGGIAVTVFDYLGDKWAALDIPGGQDSLALAGPALACSDAAVLCVPPEADAAVLAAPYLRILEETGMPTFLFVNKVDAAADRISDIVAALQTYCRHGIVLRQVPMREDGQIVGAVDLISERAWHFNEKQRSSLVPLPDDMVDREQEARAHLLESLADFDDALLEQIVEDQNPDPGEVYKVATRVLQHHELVPAMLGSAVHGNGIQRLMKSLRHEVPGVEALAARLELPAEARLAACVADHQKHVGKTVLIRALAGGVSAGDRAAGGGIGSLDPVGAKGAADPGAFALAVKSDHLVPARFCTADAALPLPAWASAHTPTLHRLVLARHEKDENKLSAALGRVAETEAGLVVSTNESTGALEIAAQGPLHLKRVADRLADTFGIEVEFGEVPTALRETIRGKAEILHRHRKQTGGAGQFADVVIEVGPGPAESGFVFTDVVKGGAVPRNYIPSVEAGARDACAEGPAGHPVVDVAVVLKDGKAHSVDSSDFAFRTAGANAMREALAQAGTRVLQPIMRVGIEVPSIFAGNLVQLVSSLKGQVLGFDSHPAAAGWDVFEALMPMGALDELGRALGSATRGTAWFVAGLDHYEEMRSPALASG